jgi:ornithine cyclodeaminase/alanine dehydrogenase-like protein (mu-crystallin family)
LVEQPARTILRAGNAEGFLNGWFAVMAVIYGDVMGVKTVTFFPGNVDLGLHTHMAVIELMRRATGEPLALMDGRVITEMRTAAVSAVALAALAPLATTSLGILGSGVEARSHIQALRQVRPAIQNIRIWSRNPANAERLAAGLAPGPVQCRLRRLRRQTLCSPQPLRLNLFSKADGSRLMLWCWLWEPQARTCAHWTTKRCLAVI